MEAVEYVFSTVVVAITTWFPMWVSERKRGLSFMTRRVFWSVLVVSFVSLAFMSGGKFLEAVGYSFVIALFSVLGSWFMYFWYETFYSRDDDE